MSTVILVAGTLAVVVVVVASVAVEIVLALARWQRCKDLVESERLRTRAIACVTRDQLICEISA